jgi:hypothetical protein
MNNVCNYEKLIEEFKQIPKIIPQTTYLDICRYPGNRFEEICSRILAFFFQPTNEHGLNDLFLQSLFDVISKENTLRIVNNQITVDTEVQTEDGKRLDILILSTDFIIGIENKIYAPLYNPLPTYKNLINQKASQNNIDNNIFKVVLSVKKITDQSELKKMKENGFVKVYYSDFFEMIKMNVGTYFSQANQRYVTIMYDFIQTIENMDGKFDNKMFRFFTENKNSIDEMISQYNNINQQIFNVQKNRISEILSKINELTGAQWWAYQGWDLGIDSFNNNTTLPRIGIESSYEFSNQNPLGKFKIYITSWKVKDFEPYAEILINKYQGKFLDIKPNGEDRVYLHTDIIENDVETVILERLQYHYFELKSIIEELSNKNKQANA